MNLYNEFDPYAAQWLRNLSDRGHIPPGFVDERSIKEVMPEDLEGYAQCHFFAGIAGWSLALELAGFPPTYPIWTGSCPCQPFSAAGKRKGVNDERHLWPDWFRLIEAAAKRKRAPAVIVGEQVASNDGREWLAGVRTDLEGLGYAVGAADLCAASEGAPHIRQRLYWVAYAENADRGRKLETEGARRGRGGLAGGGAVCGLEHAELVGLRSVGCGADDGAPRGMQGADGQRERLRLEPGSAGSCSDRLANPDGRNASAERQQRSGQHGFWSQDSIVIQCTDGKRRRIPAEPRLQPLVDGVSGGRVAKLRAAGNAICPQTAATFLKSVSEVTQ